MRLTVKEVKSFAAEHKVVAGLIIITFISGIFSSVKAKNASAVTRYMVATAKIGTISTSVSGTGTVSGAEQLDLKAKTSGDVTDLRVKTGETVEAGTIIASLDATDALHALESAQISLDKLTQPSDQSSVLAAQVTLANATSAGSDAYSHAITDTGNAILALQSVVDGMNDMLYTNTGYLGDSTVSGYGSTAAGYRLTAGSEFDAAHREFDALVADSKAVTLASASSSIEALTTENEKALTDMLQSLRDTAVAIRYIKNISSNTPDAETNRTALTRGTNAEASVSGWLSDINTNLSNIRSDENAIATAPTTIAEKQSALDKLVRGADPLDVKAQQLAVQEKQEAYNDSFVRATFPGVVGRIVIKKGDSVSSGEVVATILSQGKVANVSLNEVDAAKVKAGDKVILTFDAVDGLSITGTVTDLDLVGTVTQGVVNYNAKIAFDTDDARVLPGMSTSASIITEAKDGVLTVPSSAVKTDAKGSYVLAFDPPLAPPSPGSSSVVAPSMPPKRIAVTTGLVSDTDTEILSGLSEGEQVVERTINGTAVKAAAAPSLFGGNATNRGGAAAGNARALGR